MGVFFKEKGECVKCAAPELVVTNIRTSQCYIERYPWSHLAV